MKAPVIVVYMADSANGEFPDTMNFAAAMLPDGRPGTSWICTGATAEEARAKLEAMWRKQFPDTSNRGAHFRKPKPVETVDDCGIIL